MKANSKKERKIFANIKGSPIRKEKNQETPIIRKEPSKYPQSPIKIRDKIEDKSANHQNEEGKTVKKTLFEGKIDDNGVEQESVDDNDDNDNEDSKSTKHATRGKPTDFKVEDEILAKLEWEPEIDHYYEAIITKIEGNICTI